MRVVKAAAVQLSPVLYSRESTIEKGGAEDSSAKRTGGAVRNIPGNRRTLLPYFSFLANNYWTRVLETSRPGSECAFFCDRRYQ